MNNGSASAIIIRQKDNKVFIAQRSLNKKLSPGEWETIGGKIEENETPEQALSREIREEINVEILSYKYFKDYFWGEMISHVYIVELAGEPSPNETDFESYGWFTKEEIEKMNFAVNCKERILDYYESLNK